MTDRWRVCSPGYLLPPYLLHNYCLQTHPSALACQAAVDWKVRSEGGKEGGGKELHRNSSGHIPPPPPAQPSRYSYQWPGGGVWAFLPFAYSFSKRCIDRVSDIRIAKIDVMQNTKYYLRISHEYFWITQL